LQELLLMLDEYWDTHPEVRNVPIYQVEGEGWGSGFGCVS
jgi:hypothetical protein